MGYIYEHKQQAYRSLGLELTAQNSSDMREQDDIWYVCTGNGQSWRMGDNSHGDTSLEGEWVCYTYYRRATSDEVRLFADAQKSEEEKRQEKARQTKSKKEARREGFKRWSAKNLEGKIRCYIFEGWGRELRRQFDESDRIDNGEGVWTSLSKGGNAVGFNNYYGNALATYISPDLFDELVKQWWDILVRNLGAGAAARRVISTAHSQMDSLKTGVGFTGGEIALRCWEMSDRLIIDLVGVWRMSENEMVDYKDEPSFNVNVAGKLGISVVPMKPLSVNYNDSLSRKYPIPNTEEWVSRKYISPDGEMWGRSYYDAWMKMEGQLS